MTLSITAVIIPNSPFPCWGRLFCLFCLPDSSSLYFLSLPSFPSSPLKRGEKVLGKRPPMTITSIKTQPFTIRLKLLEIWVALLPTMFSLSNSEMLSLPPHSGLGTNFRGSKSTIFWEGRIILVFPSHKLHKWSSGEKLPGQHKLPAPRPTVSRLSLPLRPAAVLLA